MKQLHARRVLGSPGPWSLALAVAASNAFPAQAAHERPVPAERVAAGTAGDVAVATGDLAVPGGLGLSPVQTFDGQRALRIGLPATAAGMGLLLAQAGANPIQAVGIPVLMGASSHMIAGNWGKAALHPLGALAAGALGGLLGLQVWTPLTRGGGASLSTDAGADALETGVLLGLAAWQGWEAWSIFGASAQETP